MLPWVGFPPVLPNFFESPAATYHLCVGILIMVSAVRQQWTVADSLYMNNKVREKK